MTESRWFLPGWQSPLGGKEYEGHKETSGNDDYVYSLDCGDWFMSVHI